jgi:hypothetical protein
MKLTIDTLKQVGAFRGTPVEREITWMQVSYEEDENGEEIPGTREEKELTATVYVRPLSYSSVVSDLRALTGKVDGVAGRIAASICDEEGKRVFTPEDITGEADSERGELDGNLTVALLAVIGEVNSLGKTPSSAS